MFRKAVKHDAKLRMTINGPAGSGKTYTALLFASELSKRVAVVDTEHGSASKYADLWGFDVLELDSFHPQKYIDAIRSAEEAGYDVIVLDSLSHAWMGTDGLLDEVDKIAKRNRNPNTFAAWKDATPIQNKLIDTIIGARLHVVATMRTKQEYIIQEDERGKKVPKLVGMAPVQRDGMEYEFDVVAEMDNDNVMRIVKTRCPALSGGVYKKPGADVVATIKAWLSGDGPAPERKPEPEPEAKPEVKQQVKPEAKSSNWADISDDAFTVPDWFEPENAEHLAKAREHKVTFGQHKGETLGQIYDSNMGYIAWLTEKWEPGPTPTDAQKKLKNAAIYLRAYKRWAVNQNPAPMPEGMGE